MILVCFDDKFNRDLIHISKANINLDLYFTLGYHDYARVEKDNNSLKWKGTVEITRAYNWHAGDCFATQSTIYNIQYL